MDHTDNWDNKPEFSDTPAQNKAAEPREAGDAPEAQEAAKTDDRTAPAAANGAYGYREQPPVANADNFAAPAAANGAYGYWEQPAAAKKEKKGKKTGKSKKKKILLISLIVFLVLCLCVVVVGLIVLSQPDMIAKMAIADTFDTLMEHEAIDLLLEVTEAGSVEFNITENGEEDLCGKIYFDSERSQYYLENVRIDGSESFDAAYGMAEIWISPDGMGTVGLPKGEVMDHIDNTGMVDLLLLLYDYEGSEELNERMIELSEDAIDELFDLLFEYAEVESESKTVRICGEKVDATVVTIEIDAACVEDILNGFAEYLEENDELLELLEEYEDVVDYLSEGEYDAEDVIELLVEELEHMADEVGEEDFTVTVRLATKSLFAELLSFTVLYEEEGDDEEEIICIEFGPEGLDDSGVIVVYAFEEEVFSYRVTQDDDEAFKAEITVDDDIEIVFEYDYATEEWELEYAEERYVYQDVDGTFRYEWQTISFFGTLAETDDGVLFTLDGATNAYGNVTPFPGKFEIIFRREDDIPFEDVEFESLWDLSGSERAEYDAFFRTIS